MRQRIPPNALRASVPNGPDEKSSSREMPSGRPLPESDSSGELRDWIALRARAAVHAEKGEAGRTSFLPHASLLSYAAKQSIKRGEWPEVVDALDTLIRRRAVWGIGLGILAFPLAVAILVVSLWDNPTTTLDLAYTILAPLFWTAYGVWFVYENLQSLRALVQARTLFAMLHDLDGPGPPDEA